MTEVAEEIPPQPEADSRVYDDLTNGLIKILSKFFFLINSSFFKKRICKNINLIV